MGIMQMSLGVLREELSKSAPAPMIWDMESHVVEVAKSRMSVQNQTISSIGR